MAGREDERRCPRCAAPYAEGQEYCLECGERIPAAPGLTTRLGNRWRRRLGWYPGDWIWPALLTLVVAVVAGLLSAIFLADESSSAGGTLVRTLERPSTEPQRQARVRALARRVREAMLQLVVSVPAGDSPIVPVLVGDEKKALDVSARLAEKGLLVPAVRPPTVPRGSSRLRVTLSCEHTDDEVGRLVDALARVLGPVGPLA